MRYLYRMASATTTAVVALRYFIRPFTAFFVRSGRYDPFSIDCTNLWTAGVTNLGFIGYVSALTVSLSVLLSWPC